MTYQAVEALWLTRIRAMSAYDSNNSGRGTYGLLNTGAAAQYVILRPGEHTREMISPTVRWNIWTTIISVYQRYKDDGTTLTDLEAAVQALIDELDKYRHLNDSTTVTDANVIGIREYVALGAPDAPQWLRADIVGVAYEEDTLVYSD